MDYAIEVRNLNKHFAALHAVRDISFNVSRGEVLGFLGPNGAGKSTTMKMIAGFLEPSSGSAAVCGFDVSEQPLEVKQRIGYLPEGAPSYGEMTTLAFLRFIAEVRGVPAHLREARIREALRLIHLESVVDQRVETLSKGFKRRVGLAQAILHDPEVLILDEPTDGLDPNQKHEVRVLINKMAKDKAIIISTHILEEVDALCNRAVIIAKGQVQFDGTPAELQARSRLHNAVSISFNKSVEKTVIDEAAFQLQSLKCVSQVERQQDNNGDQRLLLVPLNTASIIQPVSERVQANDWPVGEIRIESGRLDEVFRNITVGCEATQAEALS